MEAFIQAAPGKPYGYFGVGLNLQGEAASTALTPQVRALEFLNTHALEPGKFICVIPRLRLQLR